MKIYTYTYITDDAETLATYSGKNVWIKCMDLKYSDSVYLRVGTKLGSYGDDYSNMCNVNILYVDDLIKLSQGELSGDEFAHLLAASYTRSLNNFAIDNPMEVLTTAELYPGYTDTSTQFDRFIGKDLWVLAHQPGFYTYYIKPISRDGFLFKYCSVPVERITGDWYSDTPFDTLLDRMEKVHTEYVDSWVIDTPLDVMTTAEIIDIQRENCEKEDEEAEE